MDDLRKELKRLYSELKVEKDYGKIDKITFKIKECEFEIKKLMTEKEKELYDYRMEKDWFRRIYGNGNIGYEQILTGHKYIFLNLVKNFKNHKVNVYFKRSDDDYNYYTYPAEKFFSQFTEVE